MKSWRAVRRGTQRSIAAGLVGLAGLLPRRLATGLFAGAGAVAYVAMARERRRVLANLALALPDLGPAARRRLARRVFTELGRNAADVCRVLVRDPRGLLPLIDVEGEEHLARARAGGRGVVAVTGHIGAWELLGGYFALRGERVHVVARRLRDRHFQEWIERVRGRLGVQVVNDDAGLRPLVRVVRSGGILGILIDQNRGARGAWIPFFGRPAYTTLGAAELARLGGAALVPMAIRRQGGRFRILIGAPVEPDWREPEASTSALAACSQALEAWIRDEPAQWAWMYDRWGGPRG